MDTLEANSLLKFKSPNIDIGRFASSKLNVKKVIKSSSTTNPTLSNVSMRSAVLPTLNLNLVDDPFDSIGNMV